MCAKGVQFTTLLYTSLKSRKQFSNASIVGTNVGIDYYSWLVVHCNASQVYTQVGLELGIRLTSQLQLHRATWL